MQIIFQSRDNILIVKLIGELDHHGAEQIREKIDNKIISSNSKSLILDLSELKFMDSSGIGIIIGRYKVISSVGGKLYIVCPSKSINKLIRMCSIEKIIVIKDTLDEIIETITKEKVQK
ncbi:MAG: STAS domain-containing protein [Ruminococcaceae bacterium]|nr:STAS domain-containing protein [Oscillospiraceae bacterium]